MKVIGLRLALPAAILAIVFCAAARVDSAEPGHSRGGVAVRTEQGGVGAKAEYCTDCHGPSGQGYHGYLTMPRLAGQTTVYIDNQLRNFAERSRERDLFINMSRVHGLSPDMRSALATHFRGLDPRPIGGGPRNLVGTGKRIYDEGIPEANIPACAACHGPDAKGQEAIPRLAGQLYAYTVKELTNWSRERGQGSAKDDTSAVMTPIAHAMTPAQVSAIAAYLSYLR
jgi:cytochrome c553